MKPKQVFKKDQQAEQKEERRATNDQDQQY